MGEGKRQLFHKWVMLLGGRKIIIISEEIISERKNKGARYILH